MDRKALEDRIVEAVRPMIEEFRSQPGEAEAEHEAALAKLQSRIDEAEEDVVRDALKVGLAKLRKDGPEKEDRSADEQMAWNGAARRLRISTRVSRARKTAGSRVRRSRKAVEQAAEQIKEALDHAAWRTKSEVQEKTELAEDLVKSGMARLKREGEIESNGQRGLAGAWRKTSK